MIDISDIKVGDRVRVTSLDGEEATFDVTEVQSRYIGSENLTVHVAARWNHIEKLAPPLPTKPGVYLPYKPKAGFIGNVWLLNGSGVWLNLPNSAGMSVTPLPPDVLQGAHERGSLIYLGTGQEQ